MCGRFSFDHPSFSHQTDKVVGYIVGAIGMQDVIARHDVGAEDVGIFEHPEYNGLGEFEFFG